MATYIETLKKPNNQDTIAPRTLSAAVSRPNGETVEDAISNVSQEVKRKNRSFIIDATLTRETMGVSPDSGKHVYHNGIDVTNNFINYSSMYNIHNTDFLSENDSFTGAGVDDYIAISDVSGSDFELFNYGADITNGDMIYPMTNNGTVGFSHAPRFAYGKEGENTKYFVRIDVIKDRDIVHYSKNDSVTDTQQSQARTNINAEKKGYITIGSTAYQVRTSTTDSGANGYITFVLE